MIVPQLPGYHCIYFGAQLVLRSVGTLVYMAASCAITSGICVSPHCARRRLPRLTTDFAANTQQLKADDKPFLRLGPEPDLSPDTSGGSGSPGAPQSRSPLQHKFRTPASSFWLGRPMIEGYRWRFPRLAQVDASNAGSPVRTAAPKLHRRRSSQLSSGCCWFSMAASLSSGDLSPQGPEPLRNTVRRDPTCPIDSGRCWLA